MADCLKRLGLLLTGLDAAKRGEARQLLLEGVAIYRDIDDHWSLTTTLNQLGQTCGVLGEYEAARQYLSEAMRIAYHSGLTPIVLEALVNLAELRLRASAATDVPTEAVELLTVSLNHPAGEQAAKDRAARLPAELEPELPAVVTTKTRAQMLTLESIVEEALSGSSFSLLSVPQAPADKSAHPTV
ncbi:MAG: tetratricopeptide repeat protein [Anaerolineae bacterium]